MEELEKSHAFTTSTFFFSKICRLIVLLSALRIECDDFCFKMIFLDTYLEVNALIRLNHCSRSGGNDVFECVTSRNVESHVQLIVSASRDP